MPYFISEIQDPELRALAELRRTQAPMSWHAYRSDDSLVHAFPWKDTPEGQVFWQGVKDYTFTKVPSNGAVDNSEPQDTTALRDHFAGLAMQGIATSNFGYLAESKIEQGSDAGMTFADQSAREAYAFADAMLAERAKRVKK